MRPRKKKNGLERQKAFTQYLVNIEDGPIESSMRDFKVLKPLALEIGCGKGDFVCGMSEQHPDICFYAMEKIQDIMITAGEKVLQHEKDRKEDNVRLMIGDANTITDWFAENSVDYLFLNFSDPWPKKGHAKRRLTHRLFLEKYFKILKPNAIIRFKTDNRALFDFTLKELSSLFLTITKVTYDLHNSEYNIGNVVTEYEENFSSQGYPIHMVEFRNPKKA